MPTEREAELRIDTLQSVEEILARVSQMETVPSQIIVITASFESLSSVKATLLSLRASDLGCVVLVQKPLEEPSFTEKQEALSMLRDWDQLLLFNVLNILSANIPDLFLSALAQEAKIEQKWFKEWVVGSQDPRMMKYPGIPWRSFIRKAVAENYTFATSVLGMGSDQTEDFQNLVSHFLSQKKQAVNIFPKRLKRNEEIAH